jgi:hypothetical protein
VGRTGTHQSPPPRTGRSPASRAPQASSSLSAHPTLVCQPAGMPSPHVMNCGDALHPLRAASCSSPALHRFSRHPRGRDVFRGLSGARMHLAVHDLSALVDVAGELLALGVGEALGGGLRGRSPHRAAPRVSQTAGPSAAADECTRAVSANHAPWFDAVARGSPQLIQLIFPRPLV